MKICKFCGNKMEDNDNYCENCGARYTENDEADGSSQDVETAQRTEGETNVEKQKEDNVSDNGSTGITNNAPAPGNKQKERTDPKKEKGIRPLNKKALGAIAGAAAVIVILVIFAVTRRPAIDLNDYAEIDVSGYDGYGSILTNVDYEQMLEDHADIFSDTDSEADELESLGNTLLAYDDAVNAIALTVEVDSSNLFNGDTVTCTWDIPESAQNEFEDTYHCRLRYSDIEYEVTGLEEIEAIDPFGDSFEITYSGISPFGEVSVSNGDYPAIRYEVSKSSGLVNGDVITVTAVLDNDENVVGYALEETSKDFTVEGLDAYVTDLSQIPDDYLSQMQSQAQDDLNSLFVGYDEDEQLVAMDYLGSYLLVHKGELGLLDHANELYLVYQVTADCPDGSITYYYYTSFNDIQIYSDGTCYTDLTDYDTPSRYGNNVTIGHYYYTGYSNLDELYNQVIAPEINDYTVTDNLQD